MNTSTPVPAKRVRDLLGLGPALDEDEALLAARELADPCRGLADVGTEIDAKTRARPSAAADRRAETVAGSSPGAIRR